MEILLLLFHLVDSDVVTAWRFFCIFPVIVLLHLSHLIPFPWATRTTISRKHIVLLMGIAPVLVSLLTFFFPIVITGIALDFFHYRFATGELGRTRRLAQTISPERSHLSEQPEKHDMIKWLNSRFVQIPILFGARINIRDPYSIPWMMNSLQDNKKGYLPQELPLRVGTRPRTLLGQPHRQLDMLPSPAMAEAAEAIVFRGKYLSGNDNLMLGVPSMFEGSGARALRYQDLSRINPEIARRRGEWGHVHSTDASWHVILHPADAFEAVVKGWAEIWPISALGFGPPGYVLIYAPRDLSEIFVFKTLMLAAYQYSLSNSQSSSCSDSPKKVSPCTSCSETVKNA